MTKKITKSEINDLETTETAATPVKKTRKGKKQTISAPVNVQSIEIIEPDGGESADVTFPGENEASGPANEVSDVVQSESNDIGAAGEIARAKDAAIETRYEFAYHVTVKKADNKTAFVIVDNDGNVLSLPFPSLQAANGAYNEFIQIKAAEYERRQNEGFSESTFEPVTMASFWINGNGKQLMSELNLLRSVAKGKNTIPVLNGIHVKAAGGRLILTGTDLDNTLVTEIPGVSIQSEGSFVVDLADFTAAIKRAQKDFLVTVKAEKQTTTYKNAGADEITSAVSYNDIRVCFESARAVFSLEGTDPVNFPELHETETPAAVGIIQSEILGQLLAKTIYAATEEQSRFTLAAVSMELGKSGEMRLVTSDGHRLAMAETPGFKKVKETPQSLLRLDGAKLLQKIAERAVFVEFTDNYINFKTRNGCRNLYSRKQPGQFPNYEMVIPEANDYEFGFQPDEVAAVLTNAMPFLTEKKSILFQPYYNNFVLKSFDQSKTFTGSARCSFEGNGAPAAGINAAYLLEACQAAAGAGVIKFAYTDFKTQLQISGGNGQIEYRFIIMPLRIDEIQKAGELGEMVNGEILTDEEKAKFQMGGGFAAAPAAPAATAPAEYENEDCFPLAESALDRMILELGRMETILQALPETERKAFSESLQVIKAELNNCQY